MPWAFQIPNMKSGLQIEKIKTSFHGGAQAAVSTRATNMVESNEHGSFVNLLYVTLYNKNTVMMRSYRDFALFILYTSHSCMNYKGNSLK